MYKHNDYTANGKQVVLYTVSENQYHKCKISSPTVNIMVSMMNGGTGRGDGAGQAAQGFVASPVRAC